ncbi:MAG: glycosyltransferase [Planctomycetales bacterium]|nr:glycosyltransferase [Planctomycetales bacterium]
MRVDFLITELNVGGAEKALTELAIGMHRRGHRVRVLSIGSEPESNRHGLVDRLSSDGVKVQFGGFDRWSRLIAAVRWTAERFGEDPPDIIQSFLFHANCLSPIASRKFCDSVLVGGLRVAESKRVRLLIEQVAVRRMAHLVCVSEQVRRFAVRSLGANPQACSVIANGVDVPTYRDATPTDWSTLGWPTDSKVVLFVGRFHPQKGIELIQQQIDKLIGHDMTRRVLLVGDGPLRRTLQKWASRIDGDRVRVLPWQPNIAPMIKAAALLVLPSHYEGMPNVVLEAMAAGRPVVCSCVEGSMELLGELGTTRCDSQGFSPGDGVQMAKLVDRLLDDPLLSRSIGDANQQHVESRFSNPKMIDRYETLYQSLLSE